MDNDLLQFPDTEENIQKENARLKALYHYQILDTPSDPAFNRITELTSNLLDVPVSCITLVDKQRIWIKSIYGSNIQELERVPGLCGSTIETNQPNIINDALTDPRTSSHPLVTKDPNVRFYAGIPLTIEGKHNLGTLCIIDFQPRIITDKEIVILKALAQLAVDELELHHSLGIIKNTNHDLAISEKNYRSIFDQAGVGVTRVDVLTGQFLEANKKYCEIVGYTLSELQQMDILQITHPDDVEHQNQLTHALITNQISEYQLQKRYIRRDKSIVWVDITCTALWEKNEIPTTRIAVVQDITDKKNAELALLKSEERWKFALEGSNQGLWDLDLSTNQIYLSPRCKQMLGYEHDDLTISMDIWSEFIHPDDLSCLNAARQGIINNSDHFFENEHRKLAQDGSWIWVQVKGMVAERDKHGTALRLIGTYTDITDKKNAEAEVIRLAHFDGITNLPNRVLFMDRLSQELKKANRSNKSLALLMLDLDRFKEVNDTLGHLQGDLVIKQTAERLLECVRDTDTVGRLGGDEFMIILPDLEDNLDVEKIASKILQRLAMPYKLDIEIAYVTASIGITLYPSDALDIEKLQKNADQAMYSAKLGGKNRYSYFTPSMQTASSEKVHLANDLRKALMSSQHEVFYQPIIDLTNMEIHKAEALMRWNHPVRGWVSPAIFIPIAEEIGEIVKLGDWVFEQAAEAVKLCRQKLYPDFKISINKSPIQFKSDATSCSSWIDHLALLGLPGDSIVVEITESLLLEKTDNITNHFKALNTAGIEVALDDFGTGYSSLSYLKQYDINYMKIDQSFVKNLTPESEDMALCEAIIVMAHKLKMRVIAEGVETEEQLQLLKSAGCDFAQGYLFSKPIPLKQFLEYSITHATNL